MVHLQMKDQINTLSRKLWSRHIKDMLLREVNNPLRMPSGPQLPPVPWEEMAYVKRAQKFLERLGVDATRERIEIMAQIEDEIADMWSDR
jgi:hypothetical protein